MQKIWIKKNTKLIISLLLFAFILSPTEIRAQNIPVPLSPPEWDILTHTLNSPVGMQGFTGAHALSNPNEPVEIIVQFVTPPYVALRLLGEKGIAHNALDERALPGVSYREQALAAHDTFLTHLRSLPVQFMDVGSVIILGEHYRLFNGLYMRVPGMLVETIANLPEVYGVFPNIPFEPLYSNSFAPSVVNPIFMSTAREFLNVDYIHNRLGITGNGVRVAVIDTGIYHNHPEFIPFHDETGRIPGWERYDNAPVSSPAYLARMHGTMVSGALISIAPGVELWHYRMELTGGGSGMHPLESIEAAHEDGMQVMNLSFGNNPDQVFDVVNSAVNIAVLDGVVVVAGAGNAGPGSATISGAPAGAALAITAGAGTAGSTHTWLGDALRSYSSRGPQMFTYHIKPDIIAPSGVMTTTIGGGYAFLPGTSASAPIIAGVAALLLEAFPEAAPVEIKARMMNTARPLVNDYNNVFEVGSGFVDPIEALTRNGNAFATVVHPVPLTDTATAPFNMQTMASLSFGLAVDMESTDFMVVTIHNPGEGVWVPQVPGGGIGAGAELEILPVSANTFDVRMVFPAGTPGGFYSDYLVFTNGERSISMPFAVHFVSTTGWQTTTDGRRYFLVNGERIRSTFTGDWLHPGIITPEMAADAAATGFAPVIRFDEDGFLVTGDFYVYQGILVFYARDSGIIHRGMLDLGFAAFYMDSVTGHAIFGWIESEGERYFARPVGHHQQGQLIRFDFAGDWLYPGIITPEMNAAAEALDVDAVIFFDWRGRLQTNDFFVFGTEQEPLVFWATETGIVHRGLLTLPWGFMYYMDRYTGAARFEWIYVDGIRRHYARPVGDALQGVLVTGDYEVDGEMHRFNENGVWVGLVPAVVAEPLFVEVEYFEDVEVEDEVGYEEETYYEYENGYYEEDVA